MAGKKPSNPFKGKDQHTYRGGEPSSLPWDSQRWEMELDQQERRAEIKAEKQDREAKMETECQKQRFQ